MCFFLFRKDPKVIKCLKVLTMTLFCSTKLKKNTLQIWFIFILWQWQMRQYIQKSFPVARRMQRIIKWTFQFLADNTRMFFGCGGFLFCIQYCLSKYTNTVAKLIDLSYAYFDLCDCRNLIVPRSHVLMFIS